MSDIHGRAMLAKAFAMTRALSRLDPTERKQHASETLMGDYNRFRERIRVSTHGELVANLPPALTPAQSNTARVVSTETLNELYVFCEQLYQLLAIEFETSGDD